jgi:peptide/nickel transport system permease protein
MASYVLRRCLAALGVLWVSSMVIFALLHLAPGSPATVLAGADATKVQVAAITRELKLNEPVPVQYWHWLSGLFTGHLGNSYLLFRPIGSLIGQRLGSTFELMIGATLVMCIGGLLLGIAAATAPRGIARSFVDLVSTVALSLPPFVSSVLFVFVFAISWKLLPGEGQANLFGDPWLAIRYLIMPSIAAGLPAAAVVGRLLATEIRRTEQDEYVRTAVSKGAGRWRVMFRHVLPNAWGPAVIEIGLRIGELFAGAVIVESLFDRQGIGSLLVTAVTDRDYLLADDLLLMSVAFAIVMQLLTELSMARVDRRLRLDGSLR